MTEYEEDIERDELMAEDRLARQRWARLCAHPDCRDPDHPGCARCEGDDDE